MIQNFPMLIFNSECIISFRFGNLFWRSRRDLNKQAAAAASIPVTELIYHDKNTSRHFLLEIFPFQRLKGKGQFDENLRSCILPRGWV